MEQLPHRAIYSSPVSIHDGERVLILGPIDNMNGTVAISTWDGTVLWPINLSDLEEI